MWDADQIGRAITRMAHQILESCGGADELILLGIPTRGVLLAQRLSAAMRAAEGAEVAVGELDITMYRDDLRHQPTRAVGRTLIPRPIDDQIVVLVDDVLHSGRTIASAIDALRDLGRPRIVQLAVLVDRGQRQLPIQPDHVGRFLPTSQGEWINLRMAEIDGFDAATIVTTGEV
ncbi:MAG: bifunctional pyr operon transcriptional regulator/uracil phosphoribosyltransferase PyrR [Micropruina sp.]|nr:bifunctional pyr operon transcriptional regulator/uracil phosphoribosyltransferase PyrR [Micropruina sp.]